MTGVPLTGSGNSVYRWGSLGGTSQNVLTCDGTVSAIWGGVYTNPRTAAVWDNANNVYVTHNSGNTWAQTGAFVLPGGAGWPIAYPVDSFLYQVALCMDENGVIYTFYALYYFSSPAPPPPTTVYGYVAASTDFGITWDLIAQFTLTLPFFPGGTTITLSAVGGTLLGLLYEVPSSTAEAEASAEGCYLFTCPYAGSSAVLPAEYPLGPGNIPYYYGLAASSFWYDSNVVYIGYGPAAMLNDPSNTSLVPVSLATVTVNDPSTGAYHVTLNGEAGPNVTGPWQPITDEVGLGEAFTFSSDHEPISLALWATADAGAMWNEAYGTASLQAGSSMVFGNGGSAVGPIFVDPTDPNNIWVIGSATDAALQSLDQGTTWNMRDITITAGDGLTFGIVAGPAAGRFAAIIGS